MNDTVESIGSWAVMLVFMAASSLVYHCLLPSGRISKTAGTLMSLLTVLCVMLPLYGIIAKNGEELMSPFSFNAEDTSMYEPYSRYAEIAKEALREQLSVIIERYTREEYRIEAEINISEDGCIDIKQVSVMFEKYPEKIEELSSEIEAVLGTVPVFGLKENQHD